MSTTIRRSVPTLRRFLYPRPFPRHPTIRSFTSKTGTPSHARKHFEQRVVPFCPRQIYTVVSNVSDYQNFVPWCTNSTVTRIVDEKTHIADLAVGFRLLSDRYTSVVSLDPFYRVSVDVPDSTLFEYLITDWKFRKVGEGATELSFYLEFAFRNPLYQKVTNLFFEEVVKQMVSAFENRCHEKYRIPNRILH